MNSILKDLTSVLLAIIGVALFAVIVSKRSNTTGVINSSSSAFNTGLATAAGPVTGYSPGPPIYASQSSSLLATFGLGVSELGAGFNSQGSY